ncbi:type II secretion system protein [Candidatus Peregrinibacteria bacterium]|nr:MAG: type II secretion system protein [Candidatus Peregrinibacteria bacterium]
MKTTNRKGFTLIELLIVIGIISILAGIVLVAVNPARQFGKANDSERKSEIGTILSAIYQFQTSPTARGALPRCLLGATPTLTAIPECDPDLSGASAGTGAFEGAVELGTPAGNSTFDCSTVLIPDYLREIPVDPNTSTYNAAGNRISCVPRHHRNRRTCLCNFRRSRSIQHRRRLSNS